MRDKEKVHDPTLVFTTDTDDGLDVVVNFGLFSGRDATPAEIYRLAEALLEHLESVEIVSEHRYEFDRAVEATVHQVRVSVSDTETRPEGTSFVEAVESWAQACIAERHVTDL